MAYQKQIYQDGITEYTDTLFEHMDDGIFGAYPVQLIAISDTAPSECVENDKYYNTSTKKIYTATGTNTWGTNGETPIEDTSYWLISENGSYAWNGTDLVSIGGGKAEVVISDEEPEDGKLWVDTAEIQTIAGRDRLVNVSTEVDEDYKVNFLKGKNLFDKNSVYKLTAYFNESTPTITSNDANRILYIPCKPNTTYTITISNATGTYSIGYTTTLPALNVSVSGVSNTLKTITTGANAKYLVIRYFQTAQASITEQQALDSIQIEEGSSSTTYEPYITPSINVDGDEIYSKDNLEQYSTSEIRIGTWIDGKPLYRKVFYITSNLSSPLDITHGISNVGYLKVEGHLTTSQTSAPSFYNNSTDFFRVFRNGAYLSARYGSSISATSITFIVEYTKTTD